MRPFSFLAQQSFSIVSTLLNQLDEEAFRFLKPHENKIICFELTDIGSLFFQITASGFVFLEPPQVADTTFKGPLNAFASMAWSQKATHPEWHIRGDLDCAKALYDSWQFLECDWEGWLANRTDPTLAHGICQGIRKGKAWLKQSYDNRVADCITYLQDEIQWLAPSHDIESFYEAIESCRDGVERLEAKINQLRKEGSS